MGIDIELYVKTTRPEWVGNWGDEAITLMDEDDRYDAPNGATHRCSSAYRLFDRSYQRGHWPQYAQWLLELFEDVEVERIWYDGDTGGPVQEMTFARFVDLCAVWVLSGHDPYRTHAGVGRDAPTPDAVAALLKAEG